MSPMRTFLAQTQVRYAETDASGIAYYGSYFVFFEIGRVEMFRTLGLPYDWRVPIVETYCRYHTSARFDDRLEIESAVVEVRSKGFRIGQRIFRGEGEDRTLVAEGFTAMVTVGEDRCPTPLPEAFRTAFGDGAQPPA